MLVLFQLLHSPPKFGILLPTWKLTNATRHYSPRRVEHFDKRICLGVSVPNLVQCKHISSSLPCANRWAGRVQHESTSLRCSSVEALGFSRRVLHQHTIHIF